jgi:hypothetical protein
MQKDLTEVHFVCQSTVEKKDFFKAEAFEIVYKLRHNGGVPILNVTSEFYKSSKNSILKINFIAGKSLKNN